MKRRLLRNVLPFIILLPLMAQTIPNITFTSPGPGAVATYANPAATNDPNDAQAWRINCSTGSIRTNPNFSDENCIEHTFNILMGQAALGGGTSAKKTFLLTNDIMNAYGSGQRIMNNRRLLSYGMSDAALQSDSVQYAGANVAGDEARGFNVVSYLKQQDHLTTFIITSPVSTTLCNTTLAQSVAASKDPQTVSVTSSLGCAVGDWVILGHKAASNTNNASAAQLTAIGASTLTGVFNTNQPLGGSVLPAQWFSVSDPNELGQDRVIVNKSTVSYTSGLVTAVSGGQFIGTGTAWTSNMVGGEATNPGCVSLAADDNILGPFAGANGPLQSWYEILGVTDNTHLGIYSSSVAGDASYRGNGPGSGAYTIRPCTRLLYLGNNGSNLTGLVVTDYNTFSWNTGDSLEEVIAPYPDVTAYQYQMACYTPGCLQRGFLNVRNTGTETILCFLCPDSNVPAGATKPAWDTLYNSPGPPHSFNTGMNITAPRQHAVNIATNEATADIRWLGGEGMLPDGNGGLIYCATASACISPAVGPSVVAAKFSAPFVGYEFTNTGSGIDRFFQFQETSANLTVFANRFGTYTNANHIGAGDAAAFPWIYDICSNTVPNMISGGTGAIPAAGGDCHDLFFMSVSNNPGSGVPWACPSTAASNCPSVWNLLTSSVWNGTAPRTVMSGMRLRPATGTNGMNTLEYRVQCAAVNNYNGALLFGCNPFSVREDGLFSINYNNNGRVFSANLDPSSLTANHTIKIPNADGTLALQSPITASGTACTITVITNGIITGATCQ